LEKRFFKTFSAENSIFPNIFGVKFSAEKSVRKIDPDEYVMNAGFYF
jgi:hypothetical protein